jgi:hypothetical protein
MQEKSNWEPEIGEEVWWVVKHQRNGLIQPPRRVVVKKKIDDTTWAVKPLKSTHRWVQIDHLKPL